MRVRLADQQSRELPHGSPGSHPLGPHCAPGSGPLDLPVRFIPGTPQVGAGPFGRPQTSSPADNASRREEGEVREIGKQKSRKLTHSNLGSQQPSRLSTTSSL